MIPLREGLDPLQMLTSASQVAEWQNERLPSDQISIENGGIITQVPARLPHAVVPHAVVGGDNAKSLVVGWNTAKPLDERKLDSQADTLARLIGV